MSLRVIPNGVYRALDYLASGVDIAFPALLGQGDAPQAALVPRLVGGPGTGYSLVTDYEPGALKPVPMTVHLALDAAKSTLLASSPWLFGFAKNGPRYWHRTCWWAQRRC